MITRNGCVVDKADVIGMLDELVDLVIQYVEENYDQEIRQDFREVRDNIIKAFEGSNGSLTHDSNSSNLKLQKK